jgi:hypothetical protein
MIKEGGRSAGPHQERLQVLRAGSADLEIPMPDEHFTHPLHKAVPTHLFSFEERIFGMTLPQLLSDLGGGLTIAALTAGLPLLPRLIIGASAAIVVLLLVHKRVAGYSLLAWLFLLVRFAAIPKETIFRSVNDEPKRGEKRGVQETWVPLSTLSHGVLGHRVQRKKQEVPDVSLWVAFHVENSQNVRSLAEADQVRFYSRINTFLDGLDFPVKFLSHVENCDPEHDPVLRREARMADALEALPELQRLQKASLAAGRRACATATKPQHYIIVWATHRDVVETRMEGASRSPLAALFALLLARRGRPVTSEEVMDQLRIRVSIVTKALSSLDVRARLLDDAGILRAYACALALGAHVPSYEVETVDEEVMAGPREEVSAGKTGGAGGGSAHEERAFPRPGEAGRRQPRRIRGLHQTFLSTSVPPHPILGEGGIPLADLVAPTSVTIERDAVIIGVRGAVRYLRYFEVTGFGSDLWCGWQEELFSLGLPMIMMTKCDPLNARMMIKKLEFHLTKLESSRIADQKHKRIPRADQQIEAEQVQAVIDALARQKLRIFAVQMVIGIHAGSRERLEQRGDYLLSHLRDMQLSVRTLSRRHDVAWQACLPTCTAGGLEHYTNLGSDVLTTFINWSGGTIGTPTGAYIGTTGSGFSRRPVRLNPWDETRRLPNPHVVIIGETGAGKSWLGKNIVLGLIGAQIADAVVLDHDNDFDPTHAYLRGASQRFNLAGSCPINIMDLPYGPDDVDRDHPVDLVAESINNHLLIGLSLLYGEPLTRTQETFLMHAAREAYAARGITSEEIVRDPETLLLEPPTFADLLAHMREVPAAAELDWVALLSRFEHLAYLFPGQTRVEIRCPLTIFNIHDLDTTWYPLMMYVVQNFLHRHRALRRNERYLAYIVEEASYMLEHPAGRRYLENGSRGFRKRGIAQFVLSQHPEDFLINGRVIIGNAGTCFFLGMQRHAAHTLNLPEELSRVLEECVPGRAIMRCGREYAAIDVADQSPLHRALFTTDPAERRRLAHRLKLDHRPSEPTTMHLHSEGESESCLISPRG